MTVSGRCHPQAPHEIPERTAAPTELVREYFPPCEWEPAGPSILVDDEGVWQRLFSPKNGAFYESLFRGDISACYNDHSYGVIELANAFIKATDFDAERVKRLLYQTGLVRPKGEERRGERT